MKHDPRHIILIPLLAIIMAACSDTPLPAPAPATGKQMRPLSFTMPSATLLPATASRADETAETEIRTAFDLENGDTPLELRYSVNIPKDKFSNITDGEMCVSYKNTGHLYLASGSLNLYDTYPTEEEGVLTFQLTKDDASIISTNGLLVGTTTVVVTKITYTAVKSSGTDPENPDDPQPGATGGLVYDGVSTQFTTGTLIGCVIAYKNAEAEGGYEYKANSCWTWHPEGLRLTKLFNADNAAIEINSDANDILRHYTTEELAAAAVDDPEIATDPRSPYFLRLLDPTAEYAFFFYYPYVDEEILTKEYETTSGTNDWGGTVYNIQNVTYPIELFNNYIYNKPSNINADVLNANTLIHQVAQGTITDNNSLHCSSWRDYPVATNLDFSIGERQDCLNYSDFMYGNLTELSTGQTITSQNAKSEIPVIMQKKMVTLDLYVLDEVIENSLSIKGGPENNTPTMRRIKKFDLQQGKFVDDFNYDPNGTNFEKNCRFEKEKPISPCKIGTATETINGVATNYNVFRVIMPPQSASEFRCSLSFKVKDSDKTLTLNEMHQNSGIKSLQSGYHYKLRFTKLNEQFGFHLDIVNWEKGDEISINRPD